MENDKKERGGKRKNALINAFGDYGSGEAGTPRYIGSKEWGTKREFVGSGDREFTFFSKTKGYLTIKANSFEEAWRQAKARGYSKRNYKE